MFVSGFSVEEVQWDDDLALWAAEDDRHFPGRNFHFSEPFFPLLVGTVQWELKGVKIGVNRSIMMYSLPGKCSLPCPKGYHHDWSINVFSGFSTF
jgi:hypothetical protein